jgi:predicted GH43/DUF377 family glycosyl hydrolase
MLKWKKLGKIFDPTEIDGQYWMKEFSQSTSTLMFDDFIRVYFSCRPIPDESGWRVSYTGFADLDKSDFSILNISKAPVLPLGDLGTFDEFAVYPISVIRYNDTVRLYYAGWSRCVSVPFNTSIGLAVSYDDGCTFKRIGKGPLLSHDVDEPFVISGPKVRIFNDKWYMYYLSGREWLIHEGKPEIVYKIRLAISKDGVNWSRINKNIINDILEPTECQAGPDVFYLDGKYHMYFVYRCATDFRNNRERAYRIGYAYSYDLINWSRDDANCGIEFNEEGWDYQMQHYPHVFFCNDNFYIIYNGNEFGKYGFGVAKLYEHTI